MRVDPDLGLDLHPRDLQLQLFLFSSNEFVSQDF